MMLFSYLSKKKKKKKITASFLTTLHSYGKCNILKSNSFWFESFQKKNFYSSVRFCTLMPKFLSLSPSLSLSLRLSLPLSLSLSISLFLFLSLLHSRPPYIYIPLFFFLIFSCLSLLFDSNALRLKANL